MSIDIQHFTPWASLIGGLLIGISASLFLLGAGRIAGIAGIVGGALQSLAKGSVQGQGVRLAFIAGLLVAPGLWSLVRPLPAVTSVAGVGGLVLAGLLVGVGVRMGNGCTSGHGVCGLSRQSEELMQWLSVGGSSSGLPCRIASRPRSGLSRFSLRSLVNVLAFMGAGFAIVFVIKHLVGI